MLPLTSDFLILYLLYFVLLSIMSYQFVNSNKTNRIRLSVIFAFLFGLNIPLYYNQEDFSQGGSLVVLFYSGIIFILALILLLINYFIRSKRNLKP